MNYLLPIKATAAESRDVNKLIDTCIIAHPNRTAVAIENVAQNMFLIFISAYISTIAYISTTGMHKALRNMLKKSAFKSV